MHQRVEPPTVAPLGLLRSASDCLSDVVAQDRAWRLNDRQVVAGVEAAYRLVTQAQTAALVLLGELDARGLAVEAGAPSTQAWLTHSQRMRPPDAKRDVTLAALICNAGQRPDPSPQTEPVEGAAVRSGLAAGDLNIDQAGCVATALAELPVDASVSTRVLAEELLVDEAGVHGPAALTRLGHRILERVDPDAADRRLAEMLAREEREARRLRSATRFADGHGSVFYRLRVPVADDVFLWPVLDTLAAPHPADDPGGAGRDERTAPQRLADAFVEAFRRVGLDGGLPTGGGDRPRALIWIGLDQLRTGVGCGLMIDTGDQLSVSAMRRLCCDAQVIPVVLGGAGQVLDVGRARRTFDGPIRVAVIARDQGCVHHGCTRPPRWADVHHVVPWWAGGATSLDNGVLLCGFHHRLYDTGTWTIRFASDGIPETIPPAWVDPRRRPRRHERFLERHPTLA